MLFSERNNYEEKPALQIEDVDATLRTRIWNILSEHVFKYQRKVGTRYISTQPLFYSDRQDLFREVWVDFFKYDVSRMSQPWNNYYLDVRLNYEQLPWHRVFTLIEFILQRFNPEGNFSDDLNRVLEEENSGYRLLQSQISPITDPVQIEEIEKASNTQLAGAKEHIRRAQELLSDKEKPDYRNSAKEAISAIEALARGYTGKKSATLGDLIDFIDSKSKQKIHGAFKEAFKKMYGYTSDKSGIRHSITEQSTVEFHDALFMLVTCSAFINYCEQVVGRS